MIRKFKPLGLAMVAVLAMSAFVASAAQAQFTANNYPTTVTATSAFGNDAFTIDGSIIECASHFEGTLHDASTTLTIKPSYTNCVSSFKATINMSFCAFILHSNDTVTIECPGSNKITITWGNCEVQIGPQGALSTVNLSNNGSHIDVKATVTGITANVTKDNFLCPLNGTGHKSASYHQQSAITAKPVSGGTAIEIDTSK